jgi:hypothetical protein
MATATETTVTVKIDPTTTSLQTDIIGPATSQNAGVMTAAQAALVAAPAGGIPIYSPSGTNGTLRPAANAVGAVAGVTAVLTVNADDGKLNYSDGINWKNFDGELT